MNENRRNCLDVLGSCLPLLLSSRASLVRHAIPNEMLEVFCCGKVCHRVVAAPLARHCLALKARVDAVTVTATIITF